MLECVLNVSEGRDPAVLARLASAAGGALLDLHRDADHHRCVLTLAGADLEAAVRAVAREAVEAVDLRRHHGVHPRIGALDVVPFVALAGSTPDDAVAARDRTAAWLAESLGLPVFLYGPERSLPEVRRRAFADLAPDHGPGRPHPTAGAAAVGARPPLVAYNLWLAEPDVALARRVARELRGPTVRALGLDVAGRAQVSLNLVEPTVLGPGEAYDAVAARAAVASAELVGLLPAAVLARVPRRRWASLDLSEEQTIEHRLGAGARDGAGGAPAGGSWSAGPGASGRA